jgi:hypothetical protein
MVAAQSGAPGRAARPPIALAIVGHRFVEEESVAPSPGAAIYLAPPEPLPP